MTTITLTKLTLIFVNRPAPKPDGKNLWIDIDVNLSKSTALIHSEEKELVGTHKQRTVTFRADHDCLLRFSNPAVFNMKSIALTAYSQTVLPLKDETKKVDTSYEVYVGTESGSAMESFSEGVVVKGGPHIVVP
jgi:hypothetical protein